MAKVKFEAMIEAAHYASDGQVDWVRAYQRRGATFSDLTIMSRAELVGLLHAGKQVAAGQRKQYEASNFGVTQEVHLVQQNGKEVLATGSARQTDFLEGVPVV